MNEYWIETTNHDCYECGMEVSYFLTVSKSGEEIEEAFIVCENCATEHRAIERELYAVVELAKTFGII